jgi:hypothetical protein
MGRVVNSTKDTVTVGNLQQVVYGKLQAVVRMNFAFVEIVDSKKSHNVDIR